MSKKIGVIAGVLLIAVVVVLVACSRSNSEVFELQEGEAEKLGVVFPEGKDLVSLYDEYMEKKEYDKAIVVAKKLKGGYYSLESAYAKAGRYEEALVVTDKILGMVPKESRMDDMEIGYILERVNLLRKLGRDEEADKEERDLAKRYEESREK